MRSKMVGTKVASHAYELSDKNGSCRSYATFRRAERMWNTLFAFTALRTHKPWVENQGLCVLLSGPQAGLSKV